jgi:hypothetical protein
MAHHSSDPSDFAGLFRDQRPPRAAFLDGLLPAAREYGAPHEYGSPPEPLGATGQFPEGKLTPEDEGEIRIGITHLDGKVVLDFGKRVAWLGLTPDQADEIAATLIKHAAEARSTAP